MSELRAIDAEPFRGFVGKLATTSLGTRPDLRWLRIDQLRIDTTYQREVLNTGARNVGKIAREFSWPKYGVIVVAALGDDLFAIIDGQHRVIGAVLRGVDEVPCSIIVATSKEQADAFAAINGAVTAISALAIFTAQIEAGDQDAVGLRDACAAAGVTVLRYQAPTNKLKPGETIAIGALWSAFRTYGGPHLSLALKCITRSGHLNIGMIRPAYITALCHVLDAEPKWCKPESRLIMAMHDFDFLTEFERAEVAARKKKWNAPTALTVRLFEFLEGEIG